MRKRILQIVVVSVAVAFVVFELLFLLSPSAGFPSWVLYLVPGLLGAGFLLVVLLTMAGKFPAGIPGKAKLPGGGAPETVVRQAGHTEWAITTYISLVVIAALVVFHIISSEGRNQPVSGTEQIVGFDTIDGEPVFLIVENMPAFGVRGYRDFRDFIQQNLRYPENARMEGTTGRVYVQFVVRRDGSVDDVKVVRGINKELDAEAIRVIQSSPGWKPGIQDGKAVNVSYSFPVVFSLD